MKQDFRAKYAQVYKEKKLEILEAIENEEMKGLVAYEILRV